MQITGRRHTSEVRNQNCLADRGNASVMHVLLSRGMTAIIDVADADAICQFSWHAHQTSPGIFYAARTDTSTGKKKTIYMHQQLTGNPQTDHDDRDRLNNRRSNLRPCTQSQNNRNCGLRADNRSGFKGVSWWILGGKWRAFIRVNSKPRWLGDFDDPRNAALAYDDAARIQFGAFASLNFPLDGERGVR